MTPVRATEEKEFLAFGHKIIGLANELSERGIGFKLSVAYGTFIFDRCKIGKMNWNDVKVKIWNNFLLFELKLLWQYFKKQ